MGLRAFALALAVLPLSCTAPEAPDGKVLVEFWDYPRLPAVSQHIADGIAEFERLNPDVHVEFTKLSWAKGGERLDIAAFAGRPPDIAGSTLTLKYVEAGLLEPMDKYLDESVPDMPGTTWREDIHPQILRAVQWQGQTWSMPWYKEGFVVLLNRDILDERGVAPPPNGRWTWDEFLVAMRQLTFDRDGDGRTDVYGIGFNTGKEKWEAYSFLLGEGMQIVSEDGRTMLIDSDATRRGIQRLLTLEYDEMVSLPGAGGIQDDTTWTAFGGTQRRLAATCQGLWSINAVAIQNERLEKQRAASDNPDDLPPPLRFEVALFPQMPGQPQIMASYGVGSYMVFKRPAGSDPEEAARRTDAAARLVRFLTLERGQQVNRAAGLLPCRKSAIGVLADDPRFANILDMMPASIGPPTHPAWPLLDQAIGEQLQLALLRRVDVDTAVRAMQERGQVVLDEFWKDRDARSGK